MKRLATYSVNPEIQQILIQTANYRQGSIVALVNESGTVGERYSYDAWGRRRNPSNWADYNVPAPRLIARGYTGHEHLDGFGLINMNGRMYDPVIGRVLSPDNFVQDPTNTQSYNRYSYCLNNPLRYTDPSGWFASASGDNATFNISNAWADRINDMNSYIYTSAYTADNGGGGGSWTNWIHDEYTNYMLMGSGAFNRMYGNGASSVARSLASNPSATNQWRQGLLSIESVRQAGGYYAQVAYTQKYSGPSTITKDGIVYTISPATGGVANKWISIGTKGQGGAAPAGQGGNGGLLNDRTSFVTTIAGSMTTLVQGSAELTQADALASINKANRIIASEREAFKTFGKVATGAKFLGNALGIISIADHSSKAYNCFSNEGLFSANGWINVGKVGIDSVLMMMKSNPIVLTISFGYGIADASGYLNYKP